MTEEFERKNDKRILERTPGKKTDAIYPTGVNKKGEKDVQCTGKTHVKSGSERGGPHEAHLGPPGGGGGERML